MKNNTMSIQEQNREEIERAIDNVKRSTWDRHFRRLWYIAAARRRRQEQWRPLAPPGRERCLRARRWTKMEQVLKIGEIDKQELAKVIVELIKHDPQVRGAVMQCAYDTPGIAVEY